MNFKLPNFSILSFLLFFLFTTPGTAKAEIYSCDYLKGEQVCTIWDGTSPGSADLKNVIKKDVLIDVIGGFRVNMAKLFEAGVYPANQISGLSLFLNMEIVRNYADINQNFRAAVASYEAVVGQRDMEAVYSRIADMIRAAENETADAADVWIPDPDCGPYTFWENGSQHNCNSCVQGNCYDPTDCGVITYWSNGHRVSVDTCDAGDGESVEQRVARFKEDFEKTLAAGGDIGAIIKALNDYLASPEAQKYAETNPEFAQAVGNLRAHSAGGNENRLSGDIFDLAGSVTGNANVNADTNVNTNVSANANVDVNEGTNTNTNNNGTPNGTVGSPGTGGSPAANLGNSPENTNEDSNQSTQLVQSSDGLTPCVGSGCARRADSVSNNGIPAAGDVLGLGIVGAGNDANASATQSYFPLPVYAGSFALNDSGGAQSESAGARTDVAANQILPLSAADFQIISPAGMPLAIAANQTSIDLQVSAPGADSVYFYLEGGSLPAALYLGAAVVDAGGIWKYKIDLNTRPLPNGDYRLWAQINQNGAAFRTEKNPLIIDIVVAVDRVGIDNLGRLFFQNKDVTAAGKKNVEQAIIETVKKAVAEFGGDKIKIEEIIRRIAAAVGEIVRLNDSLADKTVRLQTLNGRIEKLKTQIADLPQNAIELIRSDKTRELGDLQDQASRLESEISDTNAAIDQKKKEKDALAGEIRALFKGRGDESRAQKVLDDFENEISLQEAAIRQSEAVLLKDTDADGLYDEREIALGADPLNPDTDGDGILDGDEVANGYDPLKPDNFASIKYHDPQTSAPKKTDIYRFDEIDPVSTVTLSGGKTGIRFKGWGLPNSYVTLFIFSSPVIVVVKTDEQGRWTYTLDKPLDDGRHSVYAAQTDSSGRIEARSEVLVFAKNGDAVARAVADQEEEVSATGRLKNDFSLAIAIAIALALSAALFIIGAFAARARKGEQ